MHLDDELPGTLQDFIKTAGGSTNSREFVADHWPLALTPQSLVPFLHTATTIDGRATPMNGTIWELLIYIGLVLIMVIVWYYYITAVRMVPKSEEWYDDARSDSEGIDGVMFMIPYGSLIFGGGGMVGLVTMANLPETVEKVLAFPVFAVMLIGVIGITGALGIPLPWPFVPRWVADIRKTKRARMLERWRAKRMDKKKKKSQDTT